MERRLALLVYRRICILLVGVYICIHMDVSTCKHIDGQANTYASLQWMCVYLGSTQGHVQRQTSVYVAADVAAAGYWC